MLAIISLWLNENNTGVQLSFRQDFKDKDIIDFPTLPDIGFFIVPKQSTTNKQ